MKKISLIPIILLASCSLSQPADNPGSIVPLPSSQIDSSAMPSDAISGDLSLSNQAKITLPQNWFASESETSMPGELRFELYKDSKLRGHLSEYDLAAWLPANTEDDINDEQENNFRDLFSALAENKTLTIDIYELIEENDFGSLLAENDYIFKISPLVFSQDNLYGFSFLTVKGSQPDMLIPVYTAWLYDKSAESLINVQWELAENEPLLMQRNGADSNIVSNLEWLEEYVEGTPRTRLAWGEEFQTIDDLMLSYIQQEAKTEISANTAYNEFKELKLVNGGNLKVPASWQLEDSNEDIPGEYSERIMINQKMTGVLTQIDFDELAPSGDRPYENANSDQIEKFKSLMTELVYQGDFTDGLADEFKQADVGLLFSYQPGNIYNLSLLDTPEDTYGFSFTSTKGQDVLLAPRYNAYLFIPADNLLIMISYEISTNDPTIAARNQTIKSTPEDEIADVIDAQNRWIMKYVEATSTEDLSWGAVVKTVDEALLSYTR